MGSKSRVQIPVFTQTNLGTRIAIPVSPNITVAIFKGEFQRAHVDSFPELGFLSIDAVMVKWNSYFYHLPDLLPLKYVFKGFHNIWLLYVKVSLSNNLPEINNCTKVGQKKKKRKRRKRKLKEKKIAENLSCKKLEQESVEPRVNFCSVYEMGGNFPKEVMHPSTLSDTARAESPCESVSISGIINRYFTNSINVDHSSSSSEAVPSTAKNDMETCSSIKKSSKKQNSERTHQIVLPSLLPGDLNSVTPENKYERSEVGKRLVVASNTFSSTQKSASSKVKRLVGSGAQMTIRNMVFDIDNDD